MPEPKEYQEARAKLGGILRRPVSIKFFVREKGGKRKVGLKDIIQDPTLDPHIGEILTLKGEGWNLAIVSPKGKNRRIIWEDETPPPEERIPRLLRAGLC